MMQLFRDILETYWQPGIVIWRKQAAGLRESQLLAWLMGASLISFFVRLPGLVSMHGNENLAEPLTTLVGATMAATLVFGPLFLYAIAALSHLVARAFGGQGDWQSGRLALFWTILALQPLVILVEMLNNIGMSGQINALVALVSGLFFLWTWLRALIAAETYSPKKFA